MTLQEFITQQYETIDSFKRHWDHQSAINPDTYPMAMDPGEWDEQFTTYDGIMEDSE